MEAKKIIKYIYSWINFHRKTIGYLFALIIILALIFVIYLQAKQIAGQDEIHEIVLTETPIQIEDVRPKGQLYVCSAIIEDYTTRRKEETQILVFKKQHACVQMLRQKCSFVIDLDDVEYIPDGDHHVFVRLPELKYVASSQKMPFISDDDAYWADELPSTNAMKQEVARKIRKQFDTPANRQKATRYAEKAIYETLANIGYEVEFIGKIESQKK